MKRIGLIGLGDMGMGLAKNILKHGYELIGYDVRHERLAQFTQLGGKAAADCREVGANAEAVFVMVLNGSQAKEAVLGAQGLLDGLTPGATVIVSSTIHPSDVRSLEAPLTAKGVDLIDTPVSGGQGGAESGTLTMMVAAKKAVFERCRPLLEAVGEKVYHVGEEIGMGQTVKAAMQAVVCASYASLFEALVLGVKAGVKPEILNEVLNASFVASPLTRNAIPLIMERKFKGSGGQITVTHKDVGISMALGKEVGAALFTTSAAYEVFHAAKSLFPGEDNWAVVKLFEQIAGVEVKKEA
jgi:3-hydroxyisobutyrate dehydrogenase-like beta-hydroxyacid dehydrogenase